MNIRGEKLKVIKRLNIVFPLIICILLVIGSFTGCTQPQFTTHVLHLDGYKVQFQYDRSYQLFPYSRFLLRSSGPVPPRIFSGVLISIDSFPGNNGNHLELFNSYMNTQKGITYYNERNRSALNLDQLEIEYLEFGYDSYDTAPVSYEGLFFSFSIDDCIIDIEFLSSNGSLLLDDAIELFKKSLQVTELK